MSPEVKIIGDQYSVNASNKVTDSSSIKIQILPLIILALFFYSIGNNRRRLELKLLNNLIQGYRS
jgi:hypothetical protein